MAMLHNMINQSERANIISLHFTDAYIVSGEQHNKWGNSGSWSRRGQS